MSSRLFERILREGIEEDGAKYLLFPVGGKADVKNLTDKANYFLARNALSAWIVSNNPTGLGPYLNSLAIKPKKQEPDPEDPADKTTQTKKKSEPDTEEQIEGIKKEIDNYGDSVATAVFLQDPTSKKIVFYGKPAGGGVTKLSELGGGPRETPGTPSESTGKFTNGWLVTFKAAKSFQELLLKKGFELQSDLGLLLANAMKAKTGARVKGQSQGSGIGQAAGDIASDVFSGGSSGSFMGGFKT